MNKTIASRFFSATSTLIIISIAVLGITFMIFANQYFELERLNILSMCVESVEDNLEANNQQHVGRISNVIPLTENLQLISDTTQSTIILADARGQLMTCTDEKDCIHKISPVPESAVELAKTEQAAVRVSDTFSKAYGGDYYAVGKALRDKGGEVTGYIFASCTKGTISIFTNALLSMFMLSACVMILVSSIVSLAVTGKLTTPLRNITEVARRFSQGDFSARAVVEGDDEVAHLDNTFNQMAAFVENNETSRSNFVANIAHELRTPMTSIKGFVDGIIDGTIPPEKQDTYLKIVSDEIGRLASDFNHMAEEIQHSHNMQKELLASISHDLRTPLTIIKGYAESIKDITGDNREIRDQQLTTIIDETDRLSAMVGSVMEYTKLSQSTYKLNIVQFDIADMCQDIVEMYNYKAIKEGKSISYAGPQQIYVFADAALIERVIHNFVSNALVHTPPETRVGVAINVTEEGKVKVSVYDSGQGIKQEDIPHLFEKYYRARKDEGRTGSGLGLAIVKSILENHNFQYGVESREGLGTEFWFII